MNDRRRTLIAIAIILGAVALVVVGIGILVTGTSLVTPVPHQEGESPIKIIFISPSPTTSLTPSTPQP